MNPLLSPTFDFLIFGRPSLCWVQSAGVVGWRMEGRMGWVSDANGNAWDEYPLQDFRDAFGSAFCGDLTLGDFLPISAENAAVNKQS